MKINFRQGIVKYEESTGGQAFLQVPVAGEVDIVGEVSVAFAHRDANYLHIEVNTVDPAWTGVPTTGDAWLYWDIDVKTANVTYGYTTVQPTSGPTQPTALSNGLHWFDTVNNIMKVYETNRFQERIRVFAARINGTQLFPMGSNTAKPFAGSQVGINRTAFAGQILFASGLPIIVNTSNSFSPPAFGRAYVFATTETEFVTTSSQKVNTIRLESDFTTAAAAQNLAAYDIVKYNSAGRLEPAGYNDTTSTTIGIITDDVAINSIATVILQGVVTNEQWNWPVVGQELFILNNGELTANDPNLTTPSRYPVSKPPVARVLNSKEIIFMQGLGKVGPRGLNRTLGELLDVTLSNVTPSQALVFSGPGSPNLWRNADVIGADFGSPLADEDFLQFDGDSGSWTNITRRDASIGYFGLPPVERVGSPKLFQADDAGKGILSFGSPVSGSPITTSNTWILNKDEFNLGDVVTLARIPDNPILNVVAGPNVRIYSAFEATSFVGSGSPTTRSSATLGNPSKATLWFFKNDAVEGSPEEVYEYWLLDGNNITINVYQPPGAFVIAFGNDSFETGQVLPTQFTSDNDITTWTVEKALMGGSPNQVLFTEPRDIRYASDISTWVVVLKAGSGVGAGGEAMWYSTDDGVSWSNALAFGAGSPNTSETFVPATAMKNNGLAWSSELGLFVCGGNTGRVATSSDGATWTSRDIDIFGSSQIVSVHWSSALSLFIIGGSNNEVAYSSDGITWTLTEPLPGSFDAVVGMYSIGARVFASNNDTEFAYWTDNITGSPVWTQSIVDVKPVSGAGTFAANSDGSVLMWAGAGSNDGEFAWRSTDNGVNFTRINLAEEVGSPTNDYRTFCVIYDPAVGFIIGGQRSTGSPLGHVILTSPDGLTWTKQIDDKVINGSPQLPIVSRIEALGSKNQV